MADTKVTTRYIDDYEYEAENAFGNKISIDMYTAEEKHAHSPMELLLASLASCILVDVVLILKKKRKEVKDIVVHSDADRRPTAPRSFTRIHMIFELFSSNTTEEELQKIITLSAEKYCSSYHSFNPSIDISWAGKIS